MAIAEVFLSAFIPLILDKVVYPKLLELARVKGIHTQLQKCTETLRMIQAVLCDAEEKQFAERSVNIWLQDLQDLAYDLDDIVDELATKALHRQLKESSHSATASKVQKLLYTSLSLSGQKLKYKMASKFNEITKKLDDLAKRKNDLGLVVRGASTSNTPSERLTTSLVTESEIYGRDKEKEDVVKLLLRDEGCDNKAIVIPIVGMGGIGKTTLAQLIYNDARVKDYYHISGWVCVSDDFDVHRITIEIHKEVTGETGLDSFNKLQEKIKDKLSKAKFLLVLDDVWNKNYEKWDQLKQLFKVGLPGSKVIVTTREDGVAKIVSSSAPVLLETLTDNDALALLAQHALETRNFNAHPHLKDVGEKILERCKGLPLAIKALGGLLRGKETLHEWEDVLNSSLWEQNTDIIPSLRLSYKHLPSHLKPLFAYCSIFPKDYEFDKFDLVLLWMAEGFLQQSKANRQMEELGFKYFNELLSRSFFQRSITNESCFVMHDLINDLAKFVAEKICFRLDVDKGKMDLSNARHSSYSREHYEFFTKFDVFSEVPRLRTFLSLPLFVSQNRFEGFNFMRKNLLLGLFSKLPCLRVLSLSNYDNMLSLPDSIGDMKHLRYLNLSSTAIIKLPNFICDLHNLQTLLLRYCRYLIELPKNIGCLVNLRHLDNVGTYNLEKMPAGIGKLMSLVTLPEFVLGKNNGSGIDELGDLPYLKGKLFIRGLHSGVSVQEARKANLLHKEGIHELEIQWDIDDSQVNSNVKDVLDVLKPCGNLETLRICNYGGTEFPSWVQDTSLFSHLMELKLINCRNCTSLPSLGQLPSLEHLRIEGMRGVKRMGNELYLNGAGADSLPKSAFTSLEKLELGSMSALEEWSSFSVVAVEGMTNPVLFPRLCELTLWDCPELMSISLPKLPSLSHLDIRRCDEVVLRAIAASLVDLRELRISNITRLHQLDEGITKYLRGLEDLSIARCEEMRSFWKDEPASQNLISLKKLYILDCHQLVSPFSERTISTTENDGEISCCFPYLEILEICNCPSLSCFPTATGKLPTALKSLSIVGDLNNLETDTDMITTCLSLERVHISFWRSLKDFPWSYFMNLTFLKVHGCSGLEFFPERGFPLGLRYLAISECENLKSLPGQLQSLTSLEGLHIEGCPSLRSLPQGGPSPNLKSLKFGGLLKLLMTSGWELQRLTGLRTLEISSDPEFVYFSADVFLLPTSLTQLSILNCKNVESLSEGFQNLTSLQRLKISDCPKLRFLPGTLLPSLSYLKINNCPELGSLPGTLPPNLSSLTIKESPLLEKQCLKKKGDYSQMISRISSLQCLKKKGDYSQMLSRIPCFKINGEFIYD